MKFKVGDKVRYKRQNPNDNVEVGEVGTICGIRESRNDYGVAFETKDVYKHSCGGLCHDNYGWWCGEDTLEPADSKILRMADGTIIGDFGTGGFCDGFRGGKIPTPSKPVSIGEQLGLPKGVSIHDLDITSLYRPMNIDVQPLELVCNEEEAKEIAERLNKELAGRFNAFSNDGISAKNGGKNSMKFTFYVTEGYRIDKSNNTRIPTMTTEVLINGKDYQYGGSATCDKTDYEEREGVLNAIANAVCGGNFDREYEKFLANKKRRYDESCKCKICGRNYYEDEKTGKRTPFTPEDARKHEEWHEQNKKNKRERYLLRKRAKEIAFEEQAQKMAKEMMNEKK